MSDREILLAASIGIFFWIRLFRRRLLFFWMLTLPGVVLHELTHWIAALVSFGEPGPPNLIPQRIRKGYWTFGHVQCANVRWWNGWAIGLAPLSLVALGIWFINLGAESVKAGGWGLLPTGCVFLAGECFVDCWPSPQDWRIAAQSWPVLVILSGFLAYFFTR